MFSRIAVSLSFRFPLSAMKWLRVLCAVGLVVLGLHGAAHAQPTTLDADQLEELMPTSGIASNFVQVLHAQGDSLWVGPLLNVTPDGGETFLSAGREALGSNRNQVFSMDVEGQPGGGSVIWAGLAFDAGGGQAGAGGFTFSDDGGTTFTFREPQLDSPDNQSVDYGVSTLDAAPITQEAGNAPTSIDFDPRAGDVWIAGGFSGIRRSVDNGGSWQRVVLPPDSLDAIYPDSTYSFFVGPPRQGRGWLNHVGFSVLVDERGTVWAGTAAGINRSRPEDVTDGGDRIWRRFSYNREVPDGLTGNRVVTIDEQPRSGHRSAVWMATWPFNLQADDRQRFGVTVTRDGGETFEQMLIGERIFDFAFRGERIYAAGDKGLFISDDGGRTWRSIRDFPLSNPNAFVRPDVSVRAVATTNSAVWIGTDDGLLRRPVGAETWSLFRADVPVNPESPSDAVPDVETYAYPNPFSPAADRVVRIRYELDTATDVEVRIFDFNMNLVRRIVDSGQPPGEQETVWDGKDSGGLRVANGPYFYTVDLGDETVRGKILVME